MVQLPRAVLLGAAALTTESFASSWYKTITPSDDSNLCIDLPGAEAYNGNSLWLWTCNGLASQNWVFDNYQMRYGGDEDYCIDAGDMTDGQRLFLWSCNGFPQQTWGYDGDAQRVYLSNTATCLDFYGDWLSDGQPLHVWSCNDQSNQRWTLWDAPSPGPTPAPAPSPSPAPSGSCDGSCVTGYQDCNPLGIQPDATRSNNYFLALGDWGAPIGGWSCQRSVAEKMKAYISARSAEGKKLLFIAAVGDNFYYSGQNGKTWDSQWADVYGVNDPSSPFYGIPWLAVQGNHDIGSADPGCACGGGCKQFTANSPYGNLWWMPTYNWHYEIPEISLEVIGLDTNGHHVGDLNGHGAGKPVYDHCGGQSKVQDFLGGVAKEAFDKIQCRASSGTASTVVLMQHYPEDGDDVKGTFWNNRNREAQYIHLTGHTHAQKCYKSSAQCYDVLTGGGGGYKFDSWAGSAGGFTAVHLTDDGGYTSVIDSADVNVNGNCGADIAFALNSRSELHDPEMRDLVRNYSLGTLRAWEFA